MTVVVSEVVGSSGTRLVRAPRATEQQAVARERRRRVLERVLAIGVPAAFVGIWQLAASVGWIDDRLYPQPSVVVESSWELIENGKLLSDTMATTGRVLLGFGVGTISGFAVGLAMGTSRWIRVTLEPSLNALYVVPKLALLPIFLTIFGLGDASQVALAAVTVFFFVWIGSMEAIASVSEGYREAARSFGVTRWEMFRHVLLPASLPQFFVAMRIAIGVAILVVIAAEFVVGQDGLGKLIFTSRTLFINTWMYVGIVCVAIEGVLLAVVISWIGTRFTPWVSHESRRRRARASAHIH